MKSLLPFKHFGHKLTAQVAGFLVLFFIGFAATAQAPGCPNVDAGADVDLPCEESCTDLTATFLDTGETSIYEVSSIDYAPPFPFTGGTPVSVNTDDVWSDVIPLPFDFCFFGDTRTEMIIGSNGVVAFDFNDPNTTPGGFCQWSFDPGEAIPDPVELFNSTIYGVYMDIDPSVAGSGEINFGVFGEAPCRTMVINYPEIPYFSGACNALTLTSQIVIYETTNVIEVYVEERSDQCSSWNDGLAIIGIQNQDGTVGFTPPGRNTGNWAASLEAWRFTPSGESNVEFSWLDAGGAVISTDTTINVCPEGTSETYTAQAVYTNCNGDVITETDTVTVSKVASFEVDLGEDQDLCGVDMLDLTATITNGDAANATFLWSTGATTQTITVTTSDTYTVDVTLDGCTLSDSVNIILNENPAIELGEDIETCFDEMIVLDATPSNYDVADATFEWTLDGMVLGSETGPMVTVTQEGTYTVTVTVGNCSSTDTIIISGREDLIVALGPDFQSCRNELQTLSAATSEEGVTYMWYQGDETGDLIEGETGSSIDVLIPTDAPSSVTYTVVISQGGCTGSDSITITLYDIDNCIISEGISPNGDNFNQSLDLAFLSDRSGRLEMKIYNRHGRLVYERNEYVNEWEGQTTEGAELPTGVYFYVIDIENEDSVYGNQTIGDIYVNRDAN